MPLLPSSPLPTALALASWLLLFLLLGLFLLAAWAAGRGWWAVSIMRGLLLLHWLLLELLEWLLLLQLLRSGWVRGEVT